MRAIRVVRSRCRAMRLAPVDALQQHRQLSCRELHGAIANLRPGEDAGTQTLVVQHQAVPAVPEDLDLVAASATENVQIARERTFVQLMLNLGTQAIKPSSQIARAGDDPDARRVRCTDHNDRRSIDTNSAMRAIDATPDIEMRTSGPNAISIRASSAAPTACTTCADTLAIGVISTGTSFTGRVCSSSTPWRCCRHQLKIRLALIPCRREISATDAPGTHASATTRRFCSSVYARRTRWRGDISVRLDTVDASIWLPKWTRSLLPTRLGAILRDSRRRRYGS